MQIAARNPLLPARRAGCPGPCAWPTVAGSAAACWRTRAPAPLVRRSGSRQSAWTPVLFPKC